VLLSDSLRQALAPSASHAVTLSLFFTEPDAGGTASGTGHQCARQQRTGFLGPAGRRA
jgi:hypothetical protein